MLSLALPVDIYLCAQPADMRKSFDGLWAMTVDRLGRDPLRGGLFVFINRRRDRMKLLYWDVDGIAVWAKRLERGTFEMPQVDAEATSVVLSATELTLLLRGIDLASVENLVELPPETSEQLDWRPSTLFVVVHVRKKYARKEPLPESGLTLAEQNVVVAKKPAEAIPGGLAGPGLLAQVITSKGADHLPLHRLEGIFKRQGVRISRQTMDGWWLQTAEFLRPLYDLAVRVVLASHVLHTHDTSVKIRDAWRKLKHTGRSWPYVGDPLHPLTVFDYTTTHQRDGPAAFLKDYRGYLQADAFNGYDGIYLESEGRIIEVGCWARAPPRSGGPAEVLREPAAGLGPHGDGVGVDRQALGDTPGRVAIVSVCSR